MSESIQKYIILKHVLVKYNGERVLEIIDEMDRLLNTMTIGERSLANNYTLCNSD